MTLFTDTFRADQLQVAAHVNWLADAIYSSNLTAGWWDDSAAVSHDGGRTPLGSVEDKYLVPAKMALMHSELSEALEGFRKNLMDDHLPDRKMVEVEFADTIIRILDCAAHLELDVGGAIIEKLVYNCTREDHKREVRAAPGGKSI